MSQLEATDFPEANVLCAKGQNEYNALPAFINERTPTQPMVFCWKLTPEQLGDIARSGVLYQTVLTFGAPFQPVILQTDSPFDEADPEDLETCKKAYTDHREIDKAIAVTLFQIIKDLPQKRDWLDPHIEQHAKNLLRQKGLC